MTGPALPAPRRPWDGPTMRNLHRLAPCATCDARMATPFCLTCTVCHATLPDRIDAGLADLLRAAP